MLEAVLTGGTFVVPAEPGSAAMSRTLLNEMVTVLALAPVECEFLIRHVETNEAKFPSLLVIGLGSDRISARLVERARSTFHCSVVAGYGSTELGGGVSTTDPLVDGPVEDGCVGKPLPGASIRIVDELGREVPIGHIGEIRCGLATPTQGTAESHEQKDPTSIDQGEIWHSTGDAGWVDSSGRLYVLGRLDDLIIKGGNRIDPKLVERVCEEVPGFDQTAVVASTGRSDTTRIVAVYVRNYETELSVQSVSSYLVERLGRSRTPDLFVEVANIPMTSDGKVKRNEVRARIEKLFLSENPNLVQDGWALSIEHLSLQSSQA